MTAREKHIRDHLAANLEILEPEHRLSLVATEFRIMNPHGADGFIDILAKDKNEMWVVIELKRSNASARQALHEVAKYTELLREQLSIPKDRIRSIIVSTTWHELRTSASNFARDWGHDLRGYEISATPDGKISSIERVPWAPEPFEHRPSRVHCIEVYATAEERDRGWREIVEAASEAQAHHLIGFDFDRVGAPELVDGEYLLYFAVGRINPDLVPLQDSLDVTPAPDEADDPYFDIPDYYRDHPAEYRALHHICRSHRALGVSRNGMPEDFIRVCDDPLWELRSVRRSGAYATSELLTDEDLSQAVAGRYGGAQVRRQGAAGPDIRPRWESERKSTLQTLAGNEDWSVLMNQWLNEAEADASCVDVDVYVHNPCDLLQTLVYGVTDTSSPFEKYAPMLRATATYTGGRTRTTFGCLVWDGRQHSDLAHLIPPPLRDPIRCAVYRRSGAIGELDPLLIALWGLRYALMDVNPLGIQHGVLELWTAEEGDVVRVVNPGGKAAYMRPDGLMPHMLRDFVHDHFDQVQTLVQEHLRVTHL
ncbi:endonuclease NucS domain-containing protein [Nocardiopsis sp. CC223A]|uniref:endonuclease NucS domain-containing protein n=1 Tax=Nocardiopsis sp. CC223A TaxID=3044051 RepID=UPI00278C4D69|nr:endonuclease NucS domain-containing protein [Nocardiopsis sp. CC223A]